MENQNNVEKEYALETIITKAVQIPMVKVDRKTFLAETFAKDAERIPEIIENGPIAAGYTREELAKISKKLILTRTSTSSIASFAAGIPGGLAMAATIPADVLQFFGMSLRLAQELSYLYGAQDLWKDGEIDDERVRNQLIIYCGVMFGASGAAAGVRVLANQLAKQALKKLPQMALTKTFWYPVVKQIGKAIGIKVTKSTVANGVAKIVPIVGGVISGGLTFASMMPMAKRLQKTLDKANFDYTEEEFEQDIAELEQIQIDAENVEDVTEKDNQTAKEKVTAGIKNVGDGISSFFSKHVPKKKQTEEKPADDNNDVFDAIERLAKLKDSGAITQEEFDTKKQELLAKI